MSKYENLTAFIYMRLSKEDKLDESSSISNQRELIRSYCTTNKIVIIGEFFDDGFSGGNFDRPGFQEMVSSAKAKKPNLIITKDLSRLGRDMTESSYYAEQFFPNQGICCLAIHDNFDSFEENLLAPFQFAMNDVYIREVSKKIKAVLHQKKSNGQYCACPPFGYKKSSQDRNKLVPDEVTAPIVQRIFHMASIGIGLRAIATALTNDGVITPLKYRVLYRDEFSNKGAKRATDEWNYTTVKRIIQNRVYLGATCLGKTKKQSLKSSVKLVVPEDQWYIVEDTHEALISTEVFNKANGNIKRRSVNYAMQSERNGGLRESIFRGLVFCENCGAAMCSGGSVYRNDAHSYWYLSCLNIPKRSKHHCEHGARIKYQDLIDIVLNDINSFLTLSDDQIEYILHKIKTDDTSDKNNEYIDKQCETIRQEIENLNKVIEKLYHDNVLGKISDERLDSIVSGVNEQIKSQEKALSALLSQKTQSENVADKYEKFFGIVKSFSQISELTPDILHAFIDRIEIGEKSIKNARVNQHPTQNIKIFYKFIGDSSREVFAS